MPVEKLHVASLVAVVVVWTIYFGINGGSSGVDLSTESMAQLREELYEEVRKDLVSSIRKEVHAELKATMQSELNSLRRDLQLHEKSSVQHAPLPAERVSALRAAHNPPKPLPPIKVVDEKERQKIDKSREYDRELKYGGSQEDPGHVGGWLVNDTNSWEPDLWDWLIKIQKIESIVDVGCGSGLVTKYFYDRGVGVQCVEGSYDAIHSSFLPRDAIVHHDFTRGPWYPSNVVDVAYSVEFMEHLDVAHLDNVMALFKSARYIIIAASKWGGYHHANTHFPWWWIERFESYGFEYLPHMTEILKRLTPFPGRSPRGYSYLQFTGLMFRNPAVEYTKAFREPGKFLSDGGRSEREIMWGQNERLLKQCRCFLQD